MATKRSAPSRPSDTEPKRQRKTLTISKKVELLDMLKEGRSYAAVGRHYGINESSVCYIKKEENNIRTTAAMSFNKTAKRVITSRNKPISSDVRDGDEDGEAEAGPLSASPTRPTLYNASKGWFDKFQKRFGLKSVSLHGEAASADRAGAAEYVNDTFKTTIEEGEYKPEQVFNMGEMAPGFKAQKDRVTLIIRGNAVGFMIKPGLIYKSINPRALKNKNKNALPVFWMHNPKAWMTKHLTLDWFHQCFIPNVKLYLAEKRLEFKVLLIMDNAGGHAVDLSYDGVKIEFLPSNTTSLIQPMDHGIIRAFKALYTRKALQNLVEAMDSDEDFSLKAYWHEYTLASCLLNIQRAIKETKSETLNACWKNLWPEVVHDYKGSSPDEVHHSAVDKAMKLAKLLGGDGFSDMTCYTSVMWRETNRKSEPGPDASPKGKNGQCGGARRRRQGGTPYTPRTRPQASTAHPRPPHPAMRPDNPPGQSHHMPPAHTTATAPTRTADDINDLIEGHSQPLTDEDLTEMTKSASEEEEQVELGAEEEEAGLTLDHLATMVRMAKELQQVAQEWDPQMLRSLQFSNAIESGMSVYKNLLAQKKKQRQQLLIMFRTQKNTPVTPTPLATTDVKDEDTATSDEKT
uniref:HTH CENPB-type domain-containing protein n=1 Tax=Amphiprion percula TaxID=161767 RepID=A0A3P8SMD9_AMPPE